MHKPGIYAITCSVTGKMYVGSSRDMQQRWWSHQSNLRRNKGGNTPLQNSWNKYGEAAFIFSVLEVVENIDDLIPREQYYIDTLKPALNLRPIAHSNRGYHPKPESVEMMRAKLTGQKRTDLTKEKLRQARLGMEFPEEWCENISKGKTNPSATTRARMSAAKKGKPFSRVATEASIVVTRGKKRPPEVVARIKASRKARWEQQKAEGYKPPQDELGRFKKSS